MLQGISKQRWDCGFLKVRVNRVAPVKAMVTRDKLPAAGKERRVGLGRVEQLRTDRESVCGRGTVVVWGEGASKGSARLHAWPRRQGNRERRR
jgi:hypothetical protein